ncbi:TetR/AcrR family transcriptional regulator C-terminal domain-containing protein [Pseudonocardia aurantiaca]|uniref:TetR/AcrR family transcriptional regulator n=1 Tax=Pseudonocardia aurantiaca TaxID=75290 RepID=A0ABW4FNN6_9PSEU
MARSIWLRQERSGRGPAPEHSRARIAAAAVELADVGGLDAVSMRKVAAAIGAGAASLYRYVETRDELLELMADAAAGEIDLSRAPSGDWRADLVALAHELREVYRRHPWMLDIAPGRVALGPNTVDVLEYALATMQDLDAPTPAKMEAFALLNGFVALLVRSEKELGGATTEWQESQAEFLASVVTDGRHPHLAAAFATPSQATPAVADLLDSVLPRVLTGLLETGGDRP